MFSQSFRKHTVNVLRRSFATEAAHRPPVDLHGLHARYANATYVAASKAGVLDQVEQELLALQTTAATNANFSGFLENPLISRDEKVKQVEILLEGSKTSPITTNLMKTLAGNARLTELNKIADTFGQLMKAKRGEVDAVVISAEPLTAKQMEQVEVAMKNQVDKGKKVVVTTTVDPTIIGGLQVQIGDQFLDLSVKSRIEEIARTPID